MFNILKYLIFYQHLPIQFQLNLNTSTERVCSHNRLNKSDGSSSSSSSSTC